MTKFSKSSLIILGALIVLSGGLYGVWSPIHRHILIMYSNYEPTFGQQITKYGPKFSLNSLLDDFRKTHAPQLELDMLRFYRDGEGYSLRRVNYPRKWDRPICIESEINSPTIKNIIKTLSTASGVDIDYKNCKNKNIFIKFTGPIDAVSNRIFCTCGHRSGHYVDEYRSGISINVAYLGRDRLNIPDLSPRIAKMRSVFFAPDKRNGIEGFALLSNSGKSIDQAWCFISVLLSKLEKEKLIAACLVRSLGLFGGDLELVNTNLAGQVKITSEALGQLNEIYKTNVGLE